MDLPAGDVIEERIEGHVGEFYQFELAAVNVALLSKLLMIDDVVNVLRTRSILHLCIAREE